MLLSLARLMFSVLMFSELGELEHCPSKLSGSLVSEMLLMRFTSAFTVATLPFNRGCPPPPPPPPPLPLFTLPPFRFQIGDVSGARMGGVGFCLTTVLPSGGGEGSPGFLVRNLT